MHRWTIKHQSLAGRRRSTPAASRQSIVLWFLLSSTIWTRPARLAGERLIYITGDIFTGTRSVCNISLILCPKLAPVVAARGIIIKTMRVRVRPTSSPSAPRSRKMYDLQFVHAVFVRRCCFVVCHHKTVRSPRASHSRNDKRTCQPIVPGTRCRRVRVHRATDSGHCKAIAVNCLSSFP